MVNDLTASALLTGEVRLLSDGTAWRPLVHAEDICAAFLALLEAPREQVHGKAYNVGVSSENYLIRDVAELVAEVVDGSTVTFAGGASADSRNYRVSCDLIAAEVPGFRPRWTVRKGIEELVEAYQRHGLTIEVFAANDTSGCAGSRRSRARAGSTRNCAGPPTCRHDPDLRRLRRRQPRPVRRPR